jgi:hypothetical protein
MMIDKVNVRFGRDAARGLNALRIDDEHLGELLFWQIVGIGEGQGIAIERAKIANIAVQSARQNRERIWVDFFCAEQGGNCVEIGVFMGEDSVHESEL